LKILIVGATGLVGHNLTHFLSEEGHEVIGTSRGLLLGQLHTLDLADTRAVENLVTNLQPDAVVCCAAWPWVDGCESDPERAHRENALQPALLAQCAHRTGAQFVYFSTSYIFDGLNGPYDESASPNPINTYGRSKLEGERLCLEATEGKAIIARTMGVFGEEPRRKNFVCQVYDQLSSGRKMKVPADQYGNATHAKDLGRATLALLMRQATGIVNLAGPDPYLCRKDFAEQICQLCDLDSSLLSFHRTEELTQVAPRPKQAGLIITKMKQLVGFDPVKLGVSDLPWILSRR
jgi:dTDP-4-dehydrorhamnose reductase